MVPGQIGLVQATEIIKLIIKAGTPMVGKFYVYSALDLTAKFLEVGRNPDCPLCGENPRITGILEDEEGTPGVECKKPRPNA